MQRGFTKKRGSTWTALYYTSDAQGKRRQRSRGGFRTKRAAQGFLTEVLGKLQSGDYVEPAKLTFGEYLLERWLPTIERSLRPSTFDSYQRLVATYILPAVGTVPLQHLTADQLDRLYAELLRAGGQKGTGLSPKTVRYVHTTIHKSLKDAERKGLVGRNVASAADPPRLRQAGARQLRVWSAEEVQTFLRGLSEHRLAAAFTLAATTGMRRGEVLGLRWSDIDFASHRLAVRQTVLTINYQVSLGTPKTARGRRSIALDPTTLAALQAHRQRQTEEKGAVGTGYQDQDLVFAREDGTPLHPDYFSQLFDRTVARLGLPRIRLHDLRHTHATLGLAAGVHPKVMSDRLGHATVAFTQDVYMHAIPRVEQEAADQMADLIFGVKGFDAG